MARLRVRFTFPPDLIRRPLIWELGKRFDVVTNIRRANVEADTGWVVLELDGADDAIERAVDWASAEGVRVDPIEGDIVAG